MKSLAYAQERVLVGDGAADGLLAYAAKLGALHLTETIELHALRVSGEPVSAGFLLSPGVPLMTRTVASGYAEPDNDTAVEYMQQKVTYLESGSAPREGRGDDDLEIRAWYELQDGAA